MREMGHLRLLAGLAAGYVVLDRAAALAGSTRGQAGLLVGALTVAIITLAERLLFPKPLAAVPASLGFRFGRPAGRAVVAALAIGALRRRPPLRGARCRSRMLLP